MKKFSFLIVIAILSFSCVKSGDTVPNVPVNFSGAINDPRLSALNVPGGVVMISGYGVAGLILYR